jgi:hypothetical protein
MAKLVIGSPEDWTDEPLGAEVSLERKEITISPTLLKRKGELAFALGHELGHIKTGQKSEDLVTKWNEMELQATLWAAAKRGYFTPQAKRCLKRYRKRLGMNETDFAGLLIDAWNSLVEKYPSLGLPIYPITIRNWRKIWNY